MKLLNMTRAALKERMRRFSFLAMAALCLTAAFLFAPNTGQGLKTIIIAADVFAQSSNATWVPTSVAACMSFMMSFFGFVYVRGAVAIDRQTGTMETLMSGPFNRLRYAASKVLSSCALLGLLLCITIGGTVLITLVRYPGQFPSFWEFFSPFLAVLPSILFASAIAFFFEAPALFAKRGISWLLLIAYFCLLIYSFITVIELPKIQNSAVGLDITGLGLLYGSINHDAILASGSPLTSNVSLFSNGLRDGGTLELHFHGLTLLPNTFINLAIVIGCALVLMVMGALLLERAALPKTTLPSPKELPASHRTPTQPYQIATQGHYSLANCLASEAMRLFKGMSVWWIVGAVSLWIACWMTPSETSRFLLLPLIFGWSTLPLSRLGAEEHSSGMLELLGTIEGGPVRQLIASAGAAALFGVIVALPCIGRAIPEGPLSVLVVLMWAIMFPLVALGMGNATKTARLFQIISLLFLYVAINIASSLLPQQGGEAALLVLVYGALAAVSFVMVFLSRKHMQA